MSQELSEVRGVVHSASYTGEIGQRLLRVVGELAQLAGWVASDAGRYTEAQRIYLEGVSAAHCADNRPLAAQLLSSLSYQIANLGPAHDAALLARSAVRGGNFDAARDALARARRTAHGIKSARLDLRLNQVGTLLPGES